MAVVTGFDASSLDQMFQNFISSASGKAYIRNIARTSPGALDLSQVEALADIFKSYIINNAAYEMTPSQSSVLSHLVNITLSSPTDCGDGSYRIDLNLGGDTSRASLNPNNPGVYNIVSLFLHGWNCKKKLPFGMWRGQMTIARGQKSEMDFMSNAVEQFNREYSGSGATAYIGDNYS